MSSPAIRIEKVSKQYRLGTVGTGTIAHDLNRWWHRARGKEDPYSKIGEVNQRDRQDAAGEKTNYVWALKDINLEVQQGEILGIIGRNGAGKSTLLKLLSRVTAPTTGSIKTKGRIASLLEVGTGFHPELTGRENVYLNGSILGMRRHEITRQLDQIVDFSGCAKYLDTPVKRYSSGMMVRLGFAVAAHLSCEILIVDEVLAVGDAEFQRKAVDRMGAISSGQGRTIIFVSHNMTAVENICNLVVKLEFGRIHDPPGSPNIEIQNYLRKGNHWAAGAYWERQPEDQVDHDVATPLRLWFCNAEENKANAIVRSDQIGLVTFDFKVNVISTSLNVGIAVFDEKNTLLFWSVNTDNLERQTYLLEPGVHSAKCRIPKHLLNKGRYRIDGILSLHGIQWISKPDSTNVSISIEVKGGLSKSPFWTTRRPGILAPHLHWEISNKPGKRLMERIGVQGV